MRWRPMLAGLLIISSFVVPGSQLATADGEGEITLEVLSSSGYHLPAKDGGALYYVVAEAQSPADGAAADIVAQLVAYRADGSVVGQAKGYGYLPVVGPGERVPVALLLREDRVGEVARHEISITGRARAAAPPGPALQLLGADRIWETQPGTRYLLGELANLGAETLADLTLVVGFYAADGQLLQVARVPTLLAPIGPAQRTPFRVEMPTNPAVASWRFWYLATPFVGHPVPLSVSVAPAELDDYGRVVITAVVSNPSSVPARNLRAAAILRDAQGRIVNVSPWEATGDAEGVNGGASITLRMVADVRPSFDSLEVRVASGTALLVPLGGHGSFFPIVGKSSAAAPEG